MTTIPYRRRGHVDHEPKSAEEATLEGRRKEKGIEFLVKLLDIM